MIKTARKLSLFPLTVALVAGLSQAAAASERDKRFFSSVEGEWSGPGEIVNGKYKGTKFVCTFKGTAPKHTAGMTLDGGCRVGMFTQNMSASVERKGGTYRGTFMDGAKGKGLDIVDGKVNGRKVVFSLNRNALNGAMLAHIPDENTMTVTVSVRVDEELVPVIGMNLKRTDEGMVGSIANH